MDGHGIFHSDCISTGVGRHDWYVARAGGPKNQLIALLKTADGQIQSAQLVFAERIGAGDIANKLWIELPQPGASEHYPATPDILVSAAIGQVHIDGRCGLDEGIVVLLM